MSATGMQPTDPKEDEDAQSTFKTFTDFFMGIFSRSAQGQDASGAKEQREAFGNPILVVRGPKRPKYLIQAHIWSPVAFKREDLTNFYALDMEEGLDDVINWIRSANVGPSNQPLLRPVIYVIGPDHPLSQQELRQVNQELVPSGAYFYRRPYESRTFEEAIRSLRDQLELQHGTSEQADAWRRKEKTSELGVLVR